jgi:hypothetical protein
MTFRETTARLEALAAERAKMPTLAEKVTERIAAHQRVAHGNGHGDDAR